MKRIRTQKKVSAKKILLLLLGCNKKAGGFFCPRLRPNAAPTICISRKLEKKTMKKVRKKLKFMIKEVSEKETAISYRFSPFKWLF